MKTIGIFHYQVGRTDGVSLEIDKWRRVLEEMGHRVYLCAGDLGTVEGTLIEEMYHHRPDAKRLNYNTFGELRDYPDDAAYRAELLGLVDVIERIYNDLAAKWSLPVTCKGRLLCVWCIYFCVFSYVSMRHLPRLLLNKHIHFLFTICWRWIGYPMRRFRRMGNGSFLYCGRPILRQIKDAGICGWSMSMERIFGV